MFRNYALIRSPCKLSLPIVSKASGYRSCILVKGNPSSDEEVEMKQTIP